MLNCKLKAVFYVLFRLYLLNGEWGGGDLDTRFGKQLCLMLKQGYFIIQNRYLSSVLFDKEVRASPSSPVRSCITASLAPQDSNCCTAAETEVKPLKGLRIRWWSYDEIKTIFFLNELKPSVYRILHLKHE